MQLGWSRDFVGSSLSFDFGSSACFRYVTGDSAGIQSACRRFVVVTWDQSSLLSSHSAAVTGRATTVSPTKAKLNESHAGVSSVRESDLTLELCICGGSGQREWFQSPHRHAPSGAVATRRRVSRVLLEMLLTGFTRDNPPAIYSRR